MALPWLRLIDLALGLNDVVRRVRARNDNPEQARSLTSTGSTALGGVETRMAGVVVSALKEAFDRDHVRLQLEREKLEAERQRAERILKLELLRQAGEREIGRMRTVSAAGLVGLAISVALSFRAPATIGGRVLIGVALALLLGSLMCAFAEHARLSRTIAAADDRLSVESATAPQTAGVAAPWLVMAGFVAVAIAALL